MITRRSFHAICPFEYQMAMVEYQESSGTFCLVEDRLQEDSSLIQPLLSNKMEQFLEYE